MVNFRQLSVAIGLLLLNFPVQALATETGHSRSGVGNRARRDIDSAALPADLEARDPFFGLIGLAAKGIGKGVSAIVKHKNSQNKHKRRSPLAGQGGKRPQRGLPGDVGQPASQRGAREREREHCAGFEDEASPRYAYAGRLHKGIYLGELVGIPRRIW
uniref:Uncharacterized protein n=1 Tax=Bionectria ochroleuca TaxID=29856 RepID=A0A8H7K357_BIOOC